jgi:hypothetical protein
MILYNVTVSIDESIHKDWLQWMRKVHIPDVMGTGLFLESRISKIHAAEQGGMSFAITYMAKSMYDMEVYQKEHAPRLQKEHSEKFEGKFAAFRTYLELIEEFKR